MTRGASHPLLIPYLGETTLPDFQDIEPKLKQIGANVSIDKLNWIDYPYQPLVQLYIGYSKSHLWLLFDVERDFFRARVLADQDTVWEDSCVEFFVSTGRKAENEYSSTDDIVYRNFEFNALGICLSAVGNIENREFLNPEEMKQILRFPGLSNFTLPKEGDEFNWKLSVAIPLDLLGLQPGSVFRANCYKCGDLTLQPHFLSLYRITSDAPDFHLPQFFGEMELVI
jgi:hypothetical protein